MQAVTITNTTWELQKSEREMQGRTEHCSNKETNHNKETSTS